MIKPLPSSDPDEIQNLPMKKIKQERSDMQGVARFESKNP
jgi:hypothetical protein